MGAHHRARWRRPHQGDRANEIGAFAQRLAAVHVQPEADAEGFESLDTATKRTRPERADVVVFEGVGDPGGLGLTAVIEGSEGIITHPATALSCTGMTNDVHRHLFMMAK